MEQSETTKPKRKKKVYPQTSTKLDGDITRTTPSRNTEIRAVVKGDVNDKCEQMMGNQYWRLNNLYYIINEHATKILFKMNEVQEDFYRNMWYWNLIPKSRQLGFTTLIDILGLDTALFNDNMSIAIIANKLKKAEEIFNNKVKFAYDNLPDGIKEFRPASTDNKRELKFSNNSIISVDTSARGGTLNFLHVSEFAEICANRPDIAEEIVTGSLPAVHAGNMIFIESTSKGAMGYFADWCKDANDRKIQEVKPNKRQFKLSFYPWHQSSGNRLDFDDIVIFPYMKTYFEKLELEHNIALDDEQKAWYANEWLIYADKMKQENPSFFEECFWFSTEGAYYSPQFKKIREDNRITKVPYMPGYLVDTSWDIGRGDSTVIWFAQTVGRERHYIDYYENSGEWVEHYVNVIKDKADQLNYRYGRHIAPHDIEVKEWGTEFSRRETAARLGVVFDVAPNISIEDGIEASRQLLSVAWFDEEKTEEGYTKLENYKKEWDTKHGVWKNHPLHDSCSHPADGFRMDAVTWRQSMTHRRAPVNPKRVKASGWT